MYLMLAGAPPFAGKTDDEVLQKVKMGHVLFNAEAWNDVSEKARNLVRMLLKMKPAQRLTADQALSHEWIINQHCTHTSAPPPPSAFEPPSIPEFVQ